MNETEIRVSPALQATTDVARAAFGGVAVSTLIIDGADLVFGAVSGAGQEYLPGRRFPLRAGVAGWVVSSAQAVAVEDTATSGMFAQEIAESTGYVPKTIAAAPLMTDECCLGVMEVLDRTRHRGADALELLALFARQAALVLELEQAAAPSRRDEIDTLLERLTTVDHRPRAATLRLLEAVCELADHR
jgi:GAF domain-containing protein